MFLIRHLFLFLCKKYDSKFVNSLFWFNNYFEIESKYHRRICCLVLAYILSSQDVVLQSMFFLIFYWPTDHSFLLVSADVLALDL